MGLSHVSGETWASTREPCSPAASRLNKDGVFERDSARSSLLVVLEGWCLTGGGSLHWVHCVERKESWSPPREIPTRMHTLVMTGHPPWNYFLRYEVLGLRPLEASGEEEVVNRLRMVG